MDFKKQEKLFDIEWFEGPMMSLFINDKKELFIYKWVNVNDDSHTWLVFRTSKDLVTAYVRKEISGGEFILNATKKSWYLVDINPTLEFSNIRIISAQELKQTILPISDTFFRIGNCIEPESIKKFIAEVMVAV